MSWAEISVMFIKQYKAEVLRGVLLDTIVQQYRNYFENNNNASIDVIETDKKSEMNVVSWLMYVFQIFRVVFAHIQSSWSNNMFMIFYSFVEETTFAHIQG